MSSNIPLDKHTPHSIYQLEVTRRNYGLVGTNSGRSSYIDVDNTGTFSVSAQLVADGSSVSS